VLRRGVAGGLSMNTIKNIFPKVYDFENLYQAWESARKGKRYRNEVMSFSDNLETNLIDIQNHLIYGTYQVGRYSPYKGFLRKIPNKFFRWDNREISAQFQKFSVGS